MQLLPECSPEFKRKLILHIAQFIFLFTGIFSTCAAQFVYYEGVGDQRAMLLPLCNYLGMMLVGIMPDISLEQISPSGHLVNATKRKGSKIRAPSTDNLDLDEGTSCDIDSDTIPTNSLPPSDLIRRQTTDIVKDDQPLIDPEISPEANEERTSKSSSANGVFVPSLNVCIIMNVLLDFSGCVFSNVGLSMAGSGLYQVLYSSVVCWSAIFSRIIFKKIVSKDEWIGIITVTFGLAFSAMGGSSNAGHQDYVVLIGCLNTLIGAAFYGGTYVIGELALKLPDKPSPRELCVKIGVACVGIIAIYMLVYVRPNWHILVTQPMEKVGGDSFRVLVSILLYTLSQLGHGVTYFMMLGSCGAVTTGIMQSLRAVCVFAISSLMFCGVEESQCFDINRGVATLIVVVGVLFYSWAKNAALKAPHTVVRSKNGKKILKHKNYVV